MPSYAEKGFATYIHDGTNWVELNSIATSSGPNVYVRTSGTGSMDAASRILGISVHNGTSWSNVYEGYVLPPAAAPTKPTLSYATGQSTNWNSRIDTTAFTWTSVALPSGAASLQYELLTYNSSDVEITANKKTYNSSTTYSSGVPISPGGVTYYFRVRAVAYNADGVRTDGPLSDRLRVISGRSDSPYTETPHAANYWLFGRPQTSCSRAGFNYGRTFTASSSTDPYVPGTKIATQVRINTSSGYNYLGESITVSGPTGYLDTYYETSGQIVYSVYHPGGGGTWWMSASLGTNWSTLSTSCGLSFDAKPYEYGGINVSGVTTTANTQ